jgi:hypothetical protein
MAKNNDDFESFEDLSDEDLDDLIKSSENIFPMEWYDKITNVIDFTMTILEKNGPLRDREKIIQRIIDYNIEKTMNEHVNMIPLPKVYDWSKSDAVEIFEEFAYLLNLIKDRPDFKKHTIMIKFGKNKRGMEHFDFWRNMSLDEMRNIELTVENVSKTTIKCTIRNIKKDK